MANKKEIKSKSVMDFINEQKDCYHINEVGQEILKSHFKLIEDLYKKRIDVLEKENKELKARLANCIEPEFKIGQEVYAVLGDGSIKNIRVFEVNYIKLLAGTIYYCEILNGCDDNEFEEYKLFATKEQAEAKLKEMKGE